MATCFSCGLTFWGRRIEAAGIDGCFRTLSGMRSIFTTLLPALPGFRWQPWCLRYNGREVFSLKQSDWRSARNKSRDAPGIRRKSSFCLRDSPVIIAVWCPLPRLHGHFGYDFPEKYTSLCRFLCPAGQPSPFPDSLPWRTPLRRKIPGRQPERRPEIRPGRNRRSKRRWIPFQNSRPISDCEFN